ncbi:MAG: DMT family transporter, partial [Alphaproteobacteria bacterium]|nr:DMT family transporter [Alphaproteobacteria bacterium]
MSLAGFALVLAAAVCHATWNVFVKRINGGPELIWLFSLISTVLYLPLAIGIILVERPVFDLQQIIFILGSAALHLGYFLVLQMGYRNGDLSLVYPTARATGPLLSTSFAVLFLGEIVTGQMALGAGVIIFGVLMLTGGIRPGARQVSASLLFGLGAGTLIGSYTAWDAYAVSVLLIPPLLLDYASSIGRVALLAP